jgi:hypothetical protein
MSDVLVHWAAFEGFMKEAIQTANTPTVEGA